MISIVYVRAFSLVATICIRRLCAESACWLPAGDVGSVEGVRWLCAAYDAASRFAAGMLGGGHGGKKGGGTFGGEGGLGGGPMGGGGSDGGADGGALPIADSCQQPCRGTSCLAL